MPADFCALENSNQTMNTIPRNFDTNRGIKSALCGLIVNDGQIGLGALKARDLPVLEIQRFLSCS